MNTDPRRRLMGLAIVDFGWTADQFWAATPHEVFAACELVEERSKRVQ